MGSSHSVFILMSIHIHCIGKCFTANTRMAATEDDLLEPPNADFEEDANSDDDLELDDAEWAA